jgi:hypothetical protein
LPNTRVTVTVGDLEIESTERIVVRVETACGGIVGLALKQPVSIVVRSPAGTWRLDLGPSPPGEPSGRAFAHSHQEAAMTRTWTALWVGLVLNCTGADAVAAQDVRPAVFGAAGVANVYRAEDQSFGTELNIGGGLGIEWKRLGFDLEMHRTDGLTPRVVHCATANVPCVGSAREGFLEAMMLSGNVSYFFGGQRVRPYVTGSVGVLWTESVNSLTVVSSTAATLSEFHESDAGLALGVGFGVDVPLTPAVSLLPEFRTYSSVAMSRVNLGMHRGAIAVRYRW